MYSIKFFYRGIASKFFLSTLIILLVSCSNIFFSACRTKLIRQESNSKVMDKDLSKSTLARPPKAKKILSHKMLHGLQIQDEYGWMEEKDSESLTSYILKENEYAKRMTRGLDKLSLNLVKEFIKNTADDTRVILFRSGDYTYYSIQNKDQPYKSYFRAKDLNSPSQELLVDLNLIAKYLSHPTLHKLRVSFDNSFIAFSISSEGSSSQSLFLKEIDSTSDAKVIASDIKSFEWFRDNSKILYTTVNGRPVPSVLYFFDRNSNSRKKIFEETNKDFYISIKKSIDNKFLFISSRSFTSTEVYSISSSDNELKPTIIQKRIQDHYYTVDHHDGSFYILTNDKDPNFRVVRVSSSAPDMSNWREFIPPSESIIRRFIPFEKKFVICREKFGNPRIEVGSYENGKSEEIDFRERVYSVFLKKFYDYNTKSFLFSHQSFAIPPSTYEFDFNKNSRKLFYSSSNNRHLDDRYSSKLIFAPARDGESIPISLVYRNGALSKKPSPVYLVVYGAYGVTLLPIYSASRTSILDRGVVLALAHVRGGGIKGNRWHEEGRVLKKMNSVNDFLSVAQFLIQENYTSPDLLAIGGMSAGGLVVGAALNMNPSLFRVAFLRVPVLDLINMMLDTSRPNTIVHYDEYGNPNIPEQFDYMKELCPYNNIKTQKYPAILVTGRENDRKIPTWVTAKYVAKIRAHNTSKNPIIFRTYGNSGHVGSSDLMERYRDSAFSIAFILSQLGIND